MSLADVNIFIASVVNDFFHRPNVCVCFPVLLTKHQLLACYCSCSSSLLLRDDEDDEGAMRPRKGRIFTCTKHTQTHTLPHKLAPTSCRVPNSHDDHSSFFSSPPLSPLTLSSSSNAQHLQKERRFFHTKETQRVKSCPQPR